MPTFRFERQNAFTVKFSPTLRNIVSCCTSDCCGLQGSGELVILQAHEDNFKILGKYPWPNSLLEACWSPQHEELIATCSGDGSLQLWSFYVNTNHEKAVAHFQGHSGDVSSVDWSTNILSASWDCTIKIWDPFRGQQLHSWEAHSDVIHCAKWSPLMKNVIISVASDSAIKLWDMSSNKNSLATSLPNVEVLHCDWSKHDRNLFSTCGSNGEIQMWDMRQLGVPYSILRGHRKAVRRVEHSPHCRNVLGSVAYDYSTMLWDLENSRCVEKVLHHSSFVQGFNFNPFDPFEVADCGWDSLLHVFRPETLAAYVQNANYIPNKL